GEAGTLVELKRPYENQVSSWIDYMAFTHGIELNSGAAGLLQQLVGSNLSEISNEILKLAQYLGEEKRPIREEDVVHIVSRSRVENVFNLTHAIGNKDKAQALTCLANLLDNGQNELAALSLITRHVRILQRIQEGMREGLAGLKLSTKAGVPQYFLQEYIRQSQQWSSGRIHQALLALHETDRAIKSSPLSSHIWLENFIIQTCKNQSDLN
ncbi:MAG: DNA polymerase III subunit delta, partial [Bdellovibrionales bacterium]|nr:DNA polymerase III subunit delta [Bdellovibrionales bacterium]